MCARDVRKLGTPRTVAIAVFGACLIPPILSCGCGGKTGVKPPMGAATVDELLGRYRRAHENKDMDQLRGILIWESQLSYHRPALEKPVRELFEMPLAEVQYVAVPTIADGIGGRARYLIGTRDHGMSGPICGKLLLVEKTQGDQKPRMLDPSYVVVQFRDFDNRYYMDILQPVAEDAAQAYKSNTAPKYKPQPLEPIKDPFKWKRK